MSFQSPAGCCLTASVAGDPHVRGAHGDSFSMRGEHRAVYNLLSTPNVTMNMQMKAQSFASPWSRLRVNGTFASAASWVIRTPVTGSLMRLSFNSYLPHAAHIDVRRAGGGPPGRDPPGRWSSIGADGDDSWALDDDHTWVLALHDIKRPTVFVEGISVTLKKKELVVFTPQWRMRAKSTFGYPHAGVLRMNLGVTSLYPLCDHPGIAPHGILGQTFDCDGLAINGEEDSYEILDDGRTTRSRVSNAGGEVTTRAQGQGALEGVLQDYRLPSLFDISFPYSRFMADASKGFRNTSRVTGARRKARRLCQACPVASPLTGYTQAALDAEDALPNSQISDGAWSCNGLIGWKGPTVCTDSSVQHHDWAQNCPVNCAKANGALLGYTQAALDAEDALPNSQISDGAWSCNGLIGWKGPTVCTDSSVQHHDWAQNCPVNCAKANGAPLLAALPPPSAPCLRIVTSSAYLHDGTLSVSVDQGSGYTSVANDRFDRGQTVVDSCYPALLGVRVTNPTGNAWLGTIEFSEGSGWSPLTCLDCSGTGTSTSSIVVDGDSNSGMGAESWCLNTNGGATCTLVPTQSG